MPSLGLACLLHTLYLDVCMGTNVFCNLETAEDVLAFQAAQEVVVHDIGLVEFKTSQMVLLYIAVILRFLKFVQCLDYVRKHLDFLLLRKLRVKIVGLKRLFQQRQHH